MENRLRGYNHVVFVASDAARAREAWGRLFGFESLPLADTAPAFRDMDLSQFPSFYRGQPWRCEFKQVVLEQPHAFFEVDEPGRKDGFTDFMERHGAGMIHIGILVGAQRDEVIEELGCEKLLEQIFPQGMGDWCLLDTEKRLGTGLCVKSITCHDNTSQDQVPDFSEITILVQDLESALAQWKRMLGVADGDIVRADDNSAVIGGGLFPFRLVQPQEGTWYADYYALHGCGACCVSFDLSPQGQEDLEDSLESLSDCSVAAQLPDRTIYNTVNLLGINISVKK